MVGAVVCGLAAAACGSTADGTAATPITETTTSAHSKSTIVARMENNYEENPVLAIDPCHDTFIHDMESLGYELTANVVLPSGQSYFGNWTASCLFYSGTFGALINSSTGPLMRPDETLAPERAGDPWSRLTEIAGRSTIIRPPGSRDVSCMVSMTTNYGSMTITGSDRRTPNPEADCARIVALLETIEPWIND